MSADIALFYSPKATALKLTVPLAAEPSALVTDMYDNVPLL